MRAESTTAVVLRALEFGESDKIVTLLTRDAGKVTAIAKGAKRSLRRFGGALELFSYVRIDYRQRRTAELAFLERAVLVRPWRGLIASLERYGAACHVVEVADKLTAEREVGDRLFSVLVAALARLDGAEPGSLTLRLYELSALAACGYRYDFGRCTGCRRPVVPTATRSFLREGGVACGDCADRVGAGISPGRHTLELLLRLQTLVAAAVPPEGRPAADRFDLYECEAGLEDARPLPDAELARVLAVLLAPCVRGRLRAFDLIAPILQRSARLPEQDR